MIQVETDVSLDYLVMQSCNAWLAIPLVEVVELCPMTVFRTLPLAKPRVLGLTSYRQFILPVFSLSDVHRSEDNAPHMADSTSEKMAVLGEHEQPRLALPVTSIGSVLEDMQPEAFTSVDQGNGIVEKFFMDAEKGRIRKITLSSFSSNSILSS